MAKASGSSSAPAPPAGRAASAARVRWRLPSPLYAIVDVDAARPRTCLELAGAILAGGGCIVQLRMKDRPAGQMLEVARAMRALTTPAAALFIVNDRVDVALAVGADGVHLGADDMPVAAARRVAGPGLIIGRSTHDLEEARAARAAGADYLGFGPIFATATKPQAFAPRGIDALREICATVPMPIVAIGGVTESTAAAARGAGAAGIAMIGELARAHDVAAKVARLLTCLRAPSPPRPAAG